MSAPLPLVFIDGHADTTGLELASRLRRREDVQIKILPERYRKDAVARREAASESRVTVLCLPEGAARKAVELYSTTGTKILDTSCAFRIAPDWAYGLPELQESQRQLIRDASWVSNPGCYALASILSIRPLIDLELIERSIPLSIHALSGYSGGGIAMIEEHESAVVVRLAPRPYALTRRHRHLEEICQHGGLSSDPVFVPSIAGFRQGMRVWIPLHRSQLRSNRPYDAVLNALAERYAWEARVRVQGHHGPQEVASAELEPTLAAGSDRIWLHVIRQSAEHVLIVAILDNLGKGAAGTAEQNIELMLGLRVIGGHQVRSELKSQASTARLAFRRGLTEMMNATSRTRPSTNLRRHPLLSRLVMRASLLNRSIL